jgi:surfactin synthase thioesterase subunit
MKSAISNKDITESSDSAWVKRPAPDNEAKMRLFCFSYAGGTASSFRKWPEYMTDDIEICAIQLPGRENRLKDPVIKSLDAVMAQLVDELIPYMDRPFAFYGHSMGTLIAFELTRELRRRRLTGPVQLLVSGRCAPQVVDPDLQLHQLPDNEFIEGLRKYNGTPEAVLNDRQLMAFLIPLLRADFTVCETYQYVPEPPLDCPIFAFAGVNEISSQYLQGWQHQTTSDFESKLYPGGHFFINTEQKEFVKNVSEILENQFDCNYLI